MTTGAIHPPSENRLLAILPRDALARLQPHLGPVALGFRERLSAPNEPISQVYFPSNAVFSLVLPLEAGAVVEVATVGNEGMLGLPAFLGAGSIPGEVFCQIRGQALRLGAQILRQHTPGGGPLHDV